MIKVISIALFGDEYQKYAQFLPAFLRAHHNLYPSSDGWELRLYIDPGVYDEMGEQIVRYARAGLLMPGVCETSPRTKAMLWRMYPVFDPDVDYVFCRDLDATPMPRDRLCMNVFMNAAAAGCTVHTIHDNLAHTGIMGGLCGFWAPEFRRVTGWESLSDLYDAAKTADREYSEHGHDQIVLNRLLARPGGPTLLEHRYNGWAEGRPGVNPPREASKYLCRSFSQAVPDQSTWADTLGNHLGCAGYDHIAALKWWEANGNVDVTRRIRECET